MPLAEVAGAISDLRKQFGNSHFPLRESIKLAADWDRMSARESKSVRHNACSENIELRMLKLSISYIPSQRAGKAFVRSQRTQRAGLYARRATVWDQEFPDFPHPNPLGRSYVE